MRVSRVLIVVLTAGLSWCATLVLAPASSAGGPTSVLLVNSATGRAAALYHSDARYEQLSALTGASGSGPVTGETPSSDRRDALENSVSITITWLAHDVAVWRVDRIYPDAPGGLVIASRSDMSGGSVSSAEPVWHRPADAKGLVGLLNGLGLGSAGTSAVVTSTPAARAPATAAAAAPAEPVRSAQASPSSASTRRTETAGPLWGLGGAFAGAVLVLGLGRIRRVPRPNRASYPRPMARRS